MSCQAALARQIERQPMNRPAAAIADDVGDTATVEQVFQYLRPIVRTLVARQITRSTPEGFVARVEADPGNIGPGVGSRAARDAKNGPCGPCRKRKCLSGARDIVNMRP